MKRTFFLGSLAQTLPGGEGVSANTVGVSNGDDDEVEGTGGVGRSTRRDEEPWGARKLVDVFSRVQRLQTHFSSVVLLGSCPQSVSPLTILHF